VEQYSDRIKFVRLDTTTNRLVPSQYEINGTPTLIFLKAGRIINRVTGLLPKGDIAGYLNYLAGA
jgi:thioredoxin-like negative regulator of GroEL